MKNWVPLTALFGLICVMIIPSLGIWGLIIGSSCLLAILAWGISWVLDRTVTPVLARLQAFKARKAKAGRRAVHSGSGMARKA